MDAKKMLLGSEYPKNKLDLELHSINHDGSIARQAMDLLHESADSYFQSRFTFAKDVSDELLNYTWEKLNTGNWKDVSVAWRRVYSYASYIKAASLCRLLGQCVDDEQRHKQCQAATEACDMGLLMGAPILDNILSRLASTLQATSTASVCEASQCPSDTQTGEKNRENIDLHAHKKQKTHHRPTVDPGQAIPRLTCPALLQFKTHYMDKKVPVIIEGAMDHWPAMTHRKWSLDYLKQIAGSRTVPIEIGSKYTDDNWSQALMTLSDFIDRFMSGEQDTRISRKGYLAQHQLFEQIPELKQDICIPDYCCMRDTSTNKELISHQQSGIDEVTNKSTAEYEKDVNKESNEHPMVNITSGPLDKDKHHTKYSDEHTHDVDEPDASGDEEDVDANEDVDINAWFGPEGTISPLHHDPKHNCLAQVVGDKYIRLYSEEMTGFVYPHEGYLLNNTSQVNVEDPDDSQFPLFKQARYQECILKPGDILYIPPKCWHYVRSLATSFSVSFWWR